METKYLPPGEGHNNGGKKSIKTSRSNFFNVNQLVRPFSQYLNCSDCNHMTFSNIRKTNIFIFTFSSFY